MGTVYCGIDYHKRTSTLCFLNSNGNKEIQTISSDKIFECLSNRRDLLVGVEASCGVNHIVDKIKELGVAVKIINPNKFRGIGISGKKTDIKDAEALAECLRVGFVPEVYHKSIGARRLKSLLRIREQYVQSRVRMVSHSRSILREYGLKMPQSYESFLLEARSKINDLDFAPIKNNLLKMLKNIEEAKIEEKGIEDQLKILLSGDERLEQLMSIPGVGIMTTAAILAVGDDLSRFKNARMFASYLGLTPRETSSGDTRRMGGVSKAGQEIARRYLVHGARSVLIYCNKNSKDPLRKWGHRIKERRGMNKATVAMAHRLARLCFNVIKEERLYKKIMK